MPLPDCSRSRFLEDESHGELTLLGVACVGNLPEGWRLRITVYVRLKQIGAAEQIERLPNDFNLHLVSNKD